MLSQGTQTTNQPPHRLQEGAASFDAGMGFFNPASRPSRDLGVLLARTLRRIGRLRVLDLMAGCGVRALRYGLEAQAHRLVVNDADSGRLPLLRENLSVLEGTCLLSLSAQRAHRLLASCLLESSRFDLLDMDAFGSPHALIPLALEAVALDGLLYLASTDGRGHTGHDRQAGLRQLGASVRCHPASWEMALRLQLGAIARAAWCQGRGVQPVFSFSDGRTFRTAVRLRRHPELCEERHLGLLAICHRCGEQQVQSMVNLKQWEACLCPSQAFAVSGPLWIGPLQHIPTLEAMAAEAVSLPGTLCKEGDRLLGRLQNDRGDPARSWPQGHIARSLKGSQPPLHELVRRLQEQGFAASVSGVMPGHLRSDAPWAVILALAGELASAAAR